MSNYKYLISIAILVFFTSMISAQVTHVAVFCSADNKVSEHFKSVAYNLGHQLGMHGFGLITGGSKTGLMLEVTNGFVSTTKDRDTLHGIMPKVLQAYNAHHPDIPSHNLTWVDSIYIRLTHFHKLADVIVILPGGFGTLHELMDFLVHHQFALSNKPIILINIDGYWDYLLQQFNVMNQEQLLADKHLHILTVVASEDECIQKIINNNLSVNHEGLSNHYWEK